LCQRRKCDDKQQQKKQDQFCCVDPRAWHDMFDDKKCVRLSLGAFNGGEVTPPLFVSWQRRKPIVNEELLRSGRILRPTIRAHIDVGTARHWTPPCGSRKRSSSLPVPPRQPVGSFVAPIMVPLPGTVRDLCLAHSWQGTTNHGAFGHNGKWQPPNRSNSIAEQTQSISSPHLIGGRLVARRDNRTEYGFYLGQGNLPCSGSVLVCRTRGKK